jgi:hypothetical protein
MWDERELGRGSQWPSGGRGDKDNVTVAWVVAKLIPSKLATTVAICIHGGVGGASSVEDSVCTPVVHSRGDGRCVGEQDIGWRSCGVTAGGGGVPH